MKLGFTAVLLAASALFAVPGHAQAGIGASFSEAHIGPDATEPWIYGPTFSLQDEHGKSVKSGLDVRFSYLRHNGLGVNSLIAGPRFAFPVKHPKIKPYLEVLFGYLGVENRIGRPLANHFDFQFVAGIDHTLAKHLDWRVIEYSFGVPVDESDYNNRNQFSTGLIARL
jgi:hypothetical protein